MFDSEPVHVFFMRIYEMRWLKKKEEFYFAM